MVPKEYNRKIRDTKKNEKDNETVQILETNNEEKYTKFETIISHTSIGYRIWSAYITLLALVTPYIYISYAAYRIDYLLPNYVVYITETSFFINIFIKFFVDYFEEGKKYPERDKAKIAINYLHTEFFLDFIPTLPLHLW